MPAPTFSRLTPFERFLQLFTSVRPGEGRTVFLMLAQVFLLLHGYYLIKLVRETLILVEGSAEVRSYANGASPPRSSFSCRSTSCCSTISSVAATSPPCCAGSAGSLPPTC